MSKSRHFDGGVVKRAHELLLTRVLRKAPALLLCCVDYEGRAAVGDIRENSLAELWNSEILRHYRSRLPARDRGSLDLCKTCDM